MENLYLTFWWMCVVLLAGLEPCLTLPEYSEAVAFVKPGDSEGICGFRDPLILSPKTVWDQTYLKRHSRFPREEVMEMFDRSFKDYMTHAFPQDDLHPLSCTGGNSLGGFAITLVDALDTLMLLNRSSDMAHALDVLPGVLDFDRDVVINVFEVNIRMLGSLLSAHILLTRNSAAWPQYSGVFLDKATELGDRLLDAFDTRSGLPTLFLRLNDSRWGGLDCCTACGGTFLLEFGTLSRLTGDGRYKHKATLASRILYRGRSALGLLGSSMHTQHRGWTSSHTSIGRGSDSYYEYLLKAYLLLGDELYLDMFADLYNPIMKHMQKYNATGGGPSFLVDVDMHTGAMVNSTVCSLGAYWPGLQVLIGAEEDARRLHSSFSSAWRQFGFIPELFSHNLTHAIDPRYLLRPEHIESTFMLYTLTGDEQYMQMARTILQLLQLTRGPCGYTHVSNVEDAEGDDMMESYFLSETLKYLYMMFADAPGVVDYFILTTEAHLLPPFKNVLSDRKAKASYDKEVPPQCEKVCRRLTSEEQQQVRKSLTVAYPAIVFVEEDAELIRARRCQACMVVRSKAMQPSQSSK